MTPPPAREAWIDVAKGLAIILVVLFHSVMYLGGAGVTGPLTTLNPLLDTFRMPLFFFMSGILAARAVQLSFVGLFRKRMLLLLYLYLAWVTLHTLVLLLSPPIGPTATNAAPLELVTLFVRPDSNLWFIYALPLFFTVAWLVRRLPPVMPVALAAGLSAAFGSGLLHTDTPWDKMGRYLVFFLAALWLGPVVRRMVPRVRWWHVLPVLAGYAGLTVLVVRLDLLRVPFVLLATSALAVLVGILAAVALAGSGVSGWLRYLGARTLPIYLVHTFPMIVVAAVLVRIPPDLGPLAGTVLALLLAGAAIVLALVLYRLARPIPGIFTVPVAAWGPPETGPVRIRRHAEPSGIRTAPRRSGS